MRLLALAARLAAVNLCLLAFVLPAVADDDLPAAIDRPVDFVQDVQPLLQKNCYSCHGSEEQEAGLRLDSRARALAGGDGGKIIVPGKSADSRLIQIVAGRDEELGIMPPEGEGTPLTAEQVGMLRGWIDQGAVWPAEADGADADEHWSFQPIRRPPLPAVRDASWIRTPLDAFVLARLDQAGLTPSPPAARATLIRRVYFDLLGLPPTPEDVQSFLSDARPGAYARMVERALASPHYGERWGRHWLDLARYADSDGYEKDRPRPHAWRYRNWVLDALNADLPYDQFTRQQLAGDMLAGAAVEQRVASGFHRNTLHNTEGGTDQEEDRVKKTVDRTNTMGTIWLGLTVGCGQCHSHKYDPLTQREYYQLYAFFNNLDEVDIDAPLAIDHERYVRAKQQFDGQQARLEADVAEYKNTKLAAAQAQWEKTALDAAPVWRTLDVASATSRHGARLEKQDDGSLLASGDNKDSDVYTIEATVAAGPLTGIRLEVLPDDRLPKKGPGRAENGNFVLSTLRVQAAPAEGPGEPVELALANPQADFAQKDWPVAAALNDNAEDGWAVSPQFGQRHVAVFQTQPPLEFQGGTRLTIVLDQQYKGAAHNLGRFRLSVTTGPPPLSLEGLPADVADALALDAARRTPELLEWIAAYYQTRDPELLRLNKIVADHAKRAPQPSGVKAQTVARTSSPRTANIHIRGDFLHKGDPVAADTPAFLHPLEPQGEDPGRLDLVDWLFHEENPLMARVTVNRVWQRLFGRGIVATVDDLGKQGERPSHPELLDWLASEFRDGGYRIKHVQRLILLSSVYRQSAAFRSELAEVDPENVLLARQARRRVEAEVIRDLALAVSGQLDRRLGGPSVRPPQPAEYSNLTYANSAKWNVSQGGDAYRRGLYTFFQRTSPYPMLMTFDSPDATECCAQRSLSNTPLQALTLWNDPVFFQSARALGRRIVREVPAEGDADATVARRAAWSFQLCLTRAPREEELADLIALYHDQLELLRQDESLVEALAGKPAAGQAAAAELAAWMLVGRTLMNLDEFITRE